MFVGYCVHDALFCMGQTHVLLSMYAHMCMNAYMYTGAGPACTDIDASCDKIGSCKLWHVINIIAAVMNQAAGQ